MGRLVSTPSSHYVVAWQGEFGDISRIALLGRSEAGNGASLLVGTGFGGGCCGLVLKSDIVDPRACGWWSNAIWAAWILVTLLSSKFGMMGAGCKLKAKWGTQSTTTGSGRFKWAFQARWNNTTEQQQHYGYGSQALLWEKLITTARVPEKYMCILYIYVLFRNRK